MNADTQFTILGMSGSGKTCYLLGMYYKMSAGMGGYTITIDEDNDVGLRNRYEKMCDQTLGKERFPAGTDSISEFVFDLQYGYNTIMSFKWLDYPGETLRSKNEGDIEEYENIKRSIMKSSSLFICVDGSLLVGKETEKKIEKVKEKCSSIMNSFFSKYLKSNNILPPTTIIITKYDLCKEDTEEKELCDIMEESFSALFVKDKKEKIVTIIPVSIGLNIENNDYSGKLKPLNIHLPIFIGIWFVLRQKIKKYNEEYERRNKKMEQELEYLINKKKKMENNFFWFLKKKEIQNLEERINDERVRGYKDMQRMRDESSIIENYKEELEKELQKIPFVYKNGEKISFSNIV